MSTKLTAAERAIENKHELELKTMENRQEYWCIIAVVFVFLLLFAYYIMQLNTCGCVK